ncbi:MAG: Arc family DNA binding domain-containing protein [Bacteroidetes bacterium]|nr:Arc family DNA binding domain-containing protein [Bacteroidota bacterium]
MAEKKVFALRINEELLRAVERWAADEFRSVNGQLEWMISKAVKDAGRSPVSNDAESDNPKKL